MIAPLALGRKKSDIAAIAIVCGIVLCLYINLRRQGGIWWPDASRHALNGAFILDFLRALPVHDPMGYATRYYQQWPALTIGFYPPVFYVALAASYAIFGVSEAAALVVELSFLALLGCAAYRLSRRWLPAAESLAVTLLLMGAPELIFWGQQIMLDIPAYAFFLWAIQLEQRFIETGRPRWLYASVVCAVLSIGTKYNAVFIVPVMIIVLAQARGWKSLADRVVLTAAALGLVLLLPILLVFLKFGAYDLTQAKAVVGADMRWSVEGLTYYARVMGGVISWPTLLLSMGYCAAVSFARELRLPKNDAVLLLAWVSVGYIFYAMIAVKQPRHILFITYPIALTAVLFLAWVLRGLKWRSAIPVALACSVFASSLYSRPAPYVTGLRQAALDVARAAPVDSNVAFWGYLDGTFVYAMRAYANRPDLGVVRLDKLLFDDVAVSLDRGFAEKNLRPQEIIEQLRDLHVQYVVMQPDYMNRVSIIQRLQEALDSATFVKVKSISMTSDYPSRAILGNLIIYRAVSAVPPGRVAPHIQVKLINRSL